MNTDHLNPDTLAAVQRHLVAKAVAELSHERLLDPEPGFRLTSPDGRAVYEYAAERLALDHWALDEASLTRTVDGEPAALDVQAFVVEFAGVLGIPEHLLPTYLEELRRRSRRPRGSTRTPCSRPASWSTPTSRRSRRR